MSCEECSRPRSNAMSRDRARRRVVGDLAGFAAVDHCAAASISWQVPTSGCKQVDSRSAETVSTLRM